MPVQWTKSVSARGSRPGSDSSAPTPEAAFAGLGGETSSRSHSLLRRRAPPLVSLVFWTRALGLRRNPPVCRAKSPWVVGAWPGRGSPGSCSISLPHRVL